ncbi:MAG: class I SAM-dependent methyltransferase [Legionella sp.]|nr:class I SAM-dependent methyltransferase [Legionella sp.]
MLGRVKANTKKLINIAKNIVISLNKLNNISHELSAFNSSFNKLDTTANEILMLSEFLNKKLDAANLATGFEACEHLSKELSSLNASLNESLNASLNKKVHIVPLMPNERIRVVFFFQSVTTWPSLKSLWQACEEDKRFQPILILVPFQYMDRELSLYDEARAFLIKENMSFYNAASFQLELFKPHIAFLQNPYNDSLPGHLSLASLNKNGVRIAYVPYGLEIGGGGLNLQYQFNLPIHQIAWKIFARSERHKKMFAKYCKSGSGHVVVLGHPRLDTLKDVFPGTDDKALVHQIAGRLVIMWNPHFTVGKPAGWSTFDQYVNFILETTEKNPDIFLLIRPHPLLFTTMRQAGLWEHENEALFRSTISRINNCFLDESDNYHMAFSLANAMISDASSFLLEFFATEKPLLYLENPIGYGLNDDEAIVQFLYKGTSTTDIENFFTMIRNQQDPLVEVRKKAIPLFFNGLDSHVGEAIKDYLFDAITSNSLGAPNPEYISHEHKRATHYWENSSFTYLAPQDYYERQEKCLRMILEKLPPIEDALDIGCGDGLFTCVIKDYSRTVKGIDISPNLIKQAEERAAVRLDTEHMVFSIESLETIRSCGKYHFISCMGCTSGFIDTEVFIQAVSLLFAMVRPGGYLLMKESLTLNAADRICNAGEYVARYRCKDAYLRAFLHHGFKLEQEMELALDIERSLVNCFYLFKK